MRTQGDSTQKAGILLPLSALPSPHGIGDMGPTALRFLAALKASGAAAWQLLPLCPLGYGNSPYQPYASAAGEPLYISLEGLWDRGLLPECPPPFMAGGDQVDYDAVRAYKEPYFMRAFAAFTPDEGYQAFAAQPWVHAYGVFMAFKKANAMACWNTWPASQKDYPLHPSLDLAPYDKAIRYEMFLQYMFHTQWMALKKRAGAMGLALIGDLPIYVGIDSLDVWMDRQHFLLDGEGKPTFVAGVPPDYFSQTGQRWGNPLYDWAHMEQSGFAFWVDRLRHCAQLYDIIRIDHFRAFDTYWKIPATCPTAVEGEWIEAPGYALFDTLLKELPDIKIIAEDLGELRPQVYTLRDHYGFPGMLILQFALDPRKPLRPHPGCANQIIYTGTHDNQTMRGFIAAMPIKWRLSLWLRLLAAGYTRGALWEKCLCYALDAPAKWAIFPLQDVMGLPDTARINTPGTVGLPNWAFRIGDFAPALSALEKLAGLLARHGRT